ncbi:MAG: hypothetical protein KAV00_17880 [Phycisphaerae bacterium]|nr:hypothetical protein [Phycisphaerae bacterium]
MKIATSITVIIIFGAIALLTAPSVAEAPDKVAALQAQVRLLKAENNMLRATLESLRADLKKKDLEILRLKEQIRRPKIKTATRPAALNMPPIKLLAEFDGPLKLHQASMVKSAKVLQVISKTEMITEIAAGPMTTKNIPGSRNYSIFRKRSTVWLSDINTKGFVDGAYVEINKTLYVADTKRYVNALGISKTIFLLKPLPAEWEAKLPKPVTPDRKTKKKVIRRQLPKGVKRRPSRR